MSLLWHFYRNIIRHLYRYSQDWCGGRAIQSKLGSHKVTQLQASLLSHAAACFPRGSKGSHQAVASSTPTLVGHLAIGPIGMHGSAIQGSTAHDCLENSV